MRSPSTQSTQNGLPDSSETLGVVFIVAGGGAANVFVDHHEANVNLVLVFGNRQVDSLDDYGPR